LGIDVRVAVSNILYDIGRQLARFREKRSKGSVWQTKSPSFRSREYKVLVGSCSNAPVNLEKIADSKSAGFAVLAFGHRN